MARTQLTLQTIRDFDPGIVLAFNKRLAAAAADCDDRPMDDKPRKITLEVVMTPILDKGTRECDSVEIDFRCGSKQPEYRTKPYVIGLNKGGILVGDPDSPDDPNQRTFDMGEPQS
jgi:hypothetical protein